ncbi:TetR family transcriptional regulator [Neobacillus vireti]|uniref:TetR family transcriptional regulator n=1 Tax=Neobacillus vireti TaxID=220686 RepID=UPI002FFF116C
MTPIVSNEHREERKLIILNAAKEVFINKGFNATTIQDIINHSGVSRGGVYTYFQNTEDIFIEILKRRDLEDVLDLKKIYGEGKTNWEALTFVLKTIQEAIENQSDDLVPAIYEYYFTTGWGTKKHLPLLENRIEQTKNSFVSILQKGINDKEFSPKIPIEDIARTIITFCDGMYLGSFHLGPEKVKLKNQFQAFLHYLSSAL